MPVSLHAAIVESDLQILRAIARLLTKAEAHCRESGLPAEALTEARLADDMWNFAKQVDQTIHHSVRAIEAVRAGLFSPDITPAPSDFAALGSQVADAIAFLEKLDPGELDGIAERDMRFEFGELVMEFTVANFLLSFSLPNFYFHATTAYDILRNQGLELGKRDFMGRPRLKPR